MPIKLKEPHVLYDVKGRKTHVLLPYARYEKLLEQLEDSADVRSMNEVEHQETIPWEKVKKELKKKRC